MKFLALKKPEEKADEVIDFVERHTGGIAQFNPERDPNEIIFVGILPPSPDYLSDDWEKWVNISEIIHLIKKYFSIHVNVYAKEIV